MLDMLKAFFEVGCDKRLFDRLNILRETDLCEAYMGQFPVISITLKNVDGLNYESACAAMRYVIGMEASRFYFLKESSRLTEEDKHRYCSLTKVNQKVLENRSGIPAYIGDSLCHFSGVHCPCPF